MFQILQKVFVLAESTVISKKITQTLTLCFIKVRFIYEKKNQADCILRRGISLIEQAYEIPVETRWISKESL